MTIKSYVVGPGSLVIGETGTPLEISAQITSATVEWDVEADDDIPVLSGEVDPGEETHTATLTGNLLQDLSTEGFVRYSWAHKGESLPFTFIPNTVADAQITGTLKMRPVNVGGDVKSKARSDFSFPCVGEPEIGDVGEQAEG